MVVFVGISRLPGRTFGKKQYSSNRSGMQLNLMFAAARAAGIYLSVSEANRSHADQDYEWNRYQTSGPPVAARPYTSRHNGGLLGNLGHAFDLAMADGSALTQAALNWLHTHGPLYGIRPTGLSFGESWHFDQDVAPVIIASSIWKTPDADLLAAARKRKKAAAALKAAQAKARAELLKRKKVTGMGLYVGSKTTGDYYDEHASGTVKRIRDELGKRQIRAAYGFAPNMLSGEAVNALLNDRKAGRIAAAKEAAKASGVTDIAKAVESIEADFAVLTAGEVGAPGKGDDA